MKCVIVLPPKEALNYDKANDIVQWVKNANIEIADNPSANDADIIIVIGGDGTLLSAIHNYWQYNKPFFGINRGTLGFLLNQINSPKDLINGINKLDILKLKLLKAEFVLNNGQKKELFAFNDIVLKADHGTVCHGNIQGQKYPLKEFKGDGIIISTPQGTTAYNHSAGGSVLPLEHNILAITTICSITRPIRDTVAIQQITAKITHCNGDIIGHADSQSIKPIKEVTIQPSEHSVELAFIKGYDFETKRYRMDYQIT
ncbi:ATP-NAD/AcoX kinase [Candidatus Magnetoovum chiemensis]|nr:ATP-NAD/AcoX kinase [Candidatus Magnetoovum chiemensis]